jgi:hypothetical protein
LRYDFAAQAKPDQVKDLGRLIPMVLVVSWDASLLGIASHTQVTGYAEAADHPIRNGHVDAEARAYTGTTESNLVLQRDGLSHKRTLETVNLDLAACFFNKLEW